MRRVLLVGAISGLAAGLSIAAFSATAGRGPMNDALELEESLPHDHGGAVHEDLLSRGVQEVGGAIGLILFGVALGVIFMVVWAAVSRHLPAKTSIASTVQLGAIGFATIVVVPFLKYPANPPAVGDPDTINERTVQYLSAVAYSVVLVVIVWQVWNHWPGSRVARSWLAALAYGVGLAIIAFVLPETPDVVDAPTDLVWRFRLASLGGLACGWTVLSLTAGSLLSRLETPQATADGQAHHDQAAEAVASQ